MTDLYYSGPTNYRNLALVDIFQGRSCVAATDRLLVELDLLEEMGWVEERRLCVYHLTPIGAVILHSTIKWELSGGMSPPPR